MSPDNDPSWDVFLSYARKDDEKFVKKLRDDLVSEGKSVWWDREAMESRGRGFPLEIRDAIWHSNRVVAVLGPVALQSDYVRFEWSHAHLYAKAVVPILRKGAYDGLGQDTATLLFRDEMEGLTEELRPAELAERHCIDFTDDEKYPDALEELLDKLEGEILPLADLHAAPRFPPPNFVPLPKIVGMLSDLLIYDVDDPRSLRTDIRTTVLRGRGGMGKSVMANAFANAVKTRWAFLDGIFWVPIGRSPNDERLLEALRHIALHVDRNQLPTYTDRRIARTLLTEALSETRCLLILDDVWEAGDVRDFTDVLGPACSLLITTRNDDVAAGLGASRVDLETLPLKKSVALQLLGDWAKQSPETLPPEAEVVVKFCDHVPLALALCGALIQKGETSWPRLPTVLAEARERVLDSSLPAYDPKEINVFTPIAASLQYLKELDQEDEKVGKEPLHRYDSYVDLAVLPNDALTPEAVVCALWIANQALDQDLSVKLLSQLDSRALLRFLGDPPLGEILLHNLQHFFLASRIDAEETTVLHGVLGRALMQLWSTDRSRGGGGGGRNRSELWSWRKTTR